MLPQKFSACMYHVSRLSLYCGPYPLLHAFLGCSVVVHWICNTHQSCVATQMPNCCLWTFLQLSVPSCLVLSLKFWKDWILDFLTHRTRRVRLNESFSGVLSSSCHRAASSPLCPLHRRPAVVSSRTDTS